MIRLSDYLRQKGGYLNLQRGLSVFGCPAHFPDFYCDALSRLPIPFLYFRLSELSRSESYTEKIKEYREIILFNDLPLASFITAAEWLKSSIVMPAFHRGQTLSFFCPQTSDHWVFHAISANMLHDNPETLSAHLHADDLITMIKLINFQIIEPISPFEQIQLQLQVISSAPAINPLSSDVFNNTDIPADFVRIRDRLSYPVSFYSRFPEKYAGARDRLWISLFDRDTDWNNISTHPYPLELDPLVLKDPLQRRAVIHVNGPIRVLAPAGAGKTKVLINRIVHLIGIGVRPNRILALAFNTKAAEEMRQRLKTQNIPIADRLDDHGVVVRTFHSLGYELLRAYTSLSYSTDADHKLRTLLTQIVDRLQPVAMRRNEDAYRPFIEMIRRYKTDLTPHAVYLQSGSENKYPEIFQCFLKIQMEQDIGNYDDMLYLTLRILLDDENRRKSVSSRFEFILIDEFQDLNAVQLWFMRILTSPRQNLFVVGDDDQMIYGWRGANIRHILDFGKNYPFADTCILERNYRSTQTIIRHSRRLIEHNRSRVAKNIQPRESAAEGRLEIYLGQSLLDQAGWIAEYILTLRSKLAIPWQDIAILYRYHAYQIPVALALKRHHIPHTPVHYRQLFLTAPGLDLHAYLSVLLNPGQAKKSHLHRILKRPNKYISNRSIHSVSSWADLTDFIHQTDCPDRKRARAFVLALLRLQKTVLQNLSTTALLAEMEKEFHLEEFYRRQQKKPTEERDIATDDVIWEVIRSVADSMGDVQSFYQFMNSVIQSGEDSAPDKLQEPTDPNRVTLTTIHRTKGNEYRHVIYFHLSARVTEDPETIEEERRVAYVAVTRAIEDILITAPQKDYAPFLPELLLDPLLRDHSSFRLRRRLNRLLSFLPPSIRDHREWVPIRQLLRRKKYLPAVEQISRFVSAHREAYSGLMKTIQEIGRLTSELAYRRFFQKPNKLFDIFRKK